MLIFGLYEGERISLDVGVGMKVSEVRQMIQKQLNISVDQDKHDKKVLVLSWAGSDLQDPWVFSDLGILSGTTIRVNLKEEVKPVLHIHCSHSQETLNVYDNMVIGNMPIHELRSLASRKTGLPVGIFRLINSGGSEMYDGHLLEDYGIDVGHTVYLQSLDGWTEFLNLAVMGFTPQVVSQIAPDEFAGRYQMKVALFLAAHYGHVDLARSMLRQGIKASEFVGYPPQRMWCTEETGHIESRKAAVHQAVEMGQLGVLRLFVNTDITVLTAQDGEGLTALNIALRKKVKNCASFLLTKQWSKVNLTKTFALHISAYTALRQWCERAKERAFVKYGHSKSSLKRRPFHTGPLVGFGVNVDGFTPSIMTGKSKAQLQREKEREKKKLARQTSRQLSVAELAGSTHDPEAYFRQITAVQNLKTMGDKVKASGKWGRMAHAASKTNLLPDNATARSQTSSALKTPEPTKGGGEEEVEAVRLPPINHKLRGRLSSRVPPSDTKDSQSKALGGGGEKSAVSKLVKSKSNAYFMSGGTSSSQSQQALPQLQQHVTPIMKVPVLQLPNTDRSEKGRQAEVESQTDTTTSRPYFGDSRTDSPTSPIEEEPLQLSLTTLPTLLKKDSVLSAINKPAVDVPAPLASTRSFRSDGRKKKKKRRSRVSSALLLSKATSNEGAVPLPLISNERDRRPFVYYNGQREDAFVEPTISTWSKHSNDAGSTPRERAIKSLSMANTFKDKPWLTQVRIALKIASNPTGRNVRRLRSASKRTFAIQ